MSESLWTPLRRHPVFRSLWVDHLREHERFTNEDRSVEDAARAFHVGDRPRVEHLVAVRTGRARRSQA